VSQLSPIRSRAWRGVLVLVLAATATVVPRLPSARSSAAGVPNGGFENGDLSAWHGSTLSLARELPFDGAQSLLVASTHAAPVAAALVAAAGDGDRQALTLAVRATPATVGRQVRAVLGDVTGGRSVASAPTTLQPWWQTVTVTAPTASRRLQVQVGGIGDGWEAGDAFAVDDVRIASVSPTRAQVRGRALLVDDAPYVMRGTVYLPSPIGYPGLTNDWTSDPAQCQADAQLMRVAGINTIRAAIDPNTWSVSSAPECMDAFYGAGVRIIWGLTVLAQVDTSAFVEATWQQLQRAITLTKDHPATLGYSIGNEVNYLKPGGGGWWPQLDELARRAKGLDPGHVMTSTLSENQFVDATYGGVKPGFVPHIDMWGLNVFAFRGTYGATMQQARTRDATRPVWFSEFGVDRYDCVDPTPPYGLTCGPKSHEDVNAQAAWDANNWREIAAHLPSVDPAGGIVGGTAFMWSDAWWFAILFSGVGTPAERDTSGIWNGFTKDHFPDGHQSSEFYGINHATMPNTTGPRVTTASYDALATLYTGKAPTPVAPPRVTVKGCTADVDFVSAAPLFGRVDYGPVSVVRVGSAIAADSFYPTGWSQEAAPVTGHHFSLRGLLPATTYEVHARGFDGAGRPGSPDGVRFATPPTC
jgi:hypothetical protein